MASNDEQYEEQFDFLVIEDMEESKAPKEHASNNVNDDGKINSKNQSDNHQNYSTLLKHKESQNLINLDQQSRLKSVQSEENYAQQMKVSNSDSMGKNTLKYSQDSKLIISRQNENHLIGLGNQQQLLSKPSPKNRTLMGDTRSLVNDSNEPQIKKSEAIETEFGILNNRQPQRRLMRKPLPKSQANPKTQAIVETQKSTLKQSQLLSDIKQPPKMPHHQTRVNLTQPLDINLVEQKATQNQLNNLIKSNNLQDSNSNNDFPVLETSLKSNLQDSKVPVQDLRRKPDTLLSEPLEPKIQNLPTLPSHQLQSNHKQGLKISGRSNNSQLQDLSIKNGKQQIGDVIKMNQKGELELVPENDLLKPSSNNEHMYSSLTRPLSLGKVTGDKNEANLIGQINNDPSIQEKLIDPLGCLIEVSNKSGDSVTHSLKINLKASQDSDKEPLKGVSKVDSHLEYDPLKGVQKIDQLRMPQKEHEEEAIDSVIGLLNIANNKQSLSVPSSCQAIKLTQSITHSATRAIDLAEDSSQQQYKKVSTNNLSQIHPSNLQISQQSPTNLLIPKTINSLSKPTNQTNPTTPHIPCSVLQLTQHSENLQKPIFAIKQLCHITNNTQMKCSKISHSIGGSNISAVRYFGYSWDEMGKKENNDGDRPKYNRDMLFGAKAKFMREIKQQEQERKSVTEMKTLYLYMEPNLVPLMKDSLKIAQNKQPASFSFHTKFNFHQRVNLAIHLLQTLFLVHQSDFMLFPQTLFPQKSDRTFLFALKQAQSQIKNKPLDFQPQLKFAIHFLEPFKHLEGTNSNPFKLKQFIRKMLCLENQSTQLKQSKEDPKKAPDSAKPQKTIPTQLKSPQIRFYQQDWFWEVLNKSTHNFINQQSQIISTSQLINPKWLDLFEAPLTCLNLIFGEQIISTLIEKKYEEILKNVHKIKPKEKSKPTEPPKKPTKFDPTLLAKPQESAKQKIQLASQLLALSFLTPKIQEEILKFCQKPLLSWRQFETSYKQFQQKNQKAPQAINKQPTPKSSQEQSILTNPEARKIFEQISNWISFLPFHEVSQGKFERKRLTSLKDLYEKLIKFKTSQKTINLVPPVFNLKSNSKPQGQIRQSGTKKSRSEILDKQQTKPKESVKLSGLTVLSLQSTTKSLAQVRIKYLNLLQTNKTISKQQLESQYIKRPQTHLLTQQLKKKLSAAFLSHSGIMKSPKNFTLIYKSSVFNFATKKFYQYCENRERLLYVLKIKSDRTLFYYNEDKILRNKQMNGLFGGFVKDTKGTSFLYTGEEVLKVKNVSKAFAVSHAHGPIIGEGDIVIKEGNIDNECNYPKSYEQGKKTQKLLKSNRFVLDQMDVYEIGF